jgi:aldehyde dehydrogenase (NAD+)
MFTGGSEKGKLVAGAAAKNLVPCILELGGKSPCIVDESCDVEFAAKKVAFGRYINSGQVCIAPDFVMVHSKVQDKFLEYLKKFITEFWDDGKNTQDLGKVLNDFHKERLCSMLEHHNGTVVIGNANAYKDKNLLPTVILNPSYDSKVMKEEIFGPILPVVTFTVFDEVIKYVAS